MYITIYYNIIESTGDDDSILEYTVPPHISQRGKKGTTIKNNLFTV